MRLIAKQIELVQRSWRGILPIRDTFAEVFYGKLFSLDPSLKPLFRGEMQDQGRNLAAVISIAVTGLSRLETITLAIQELGRRHAAYGVRHRHYDSFAEALMWTLAHSLGEAFTDDVKDAWAAAYRVLAETMKSGVPSTADAR